MKGAPSPLKLPARPWQVLLNLDAGNRASGKRRSLRCCSERFKMYSERIGKGKFDLEYACNVNPLGNLLVDSVVPFSNSLEAGTIARYLHTKFSRNRYLP